MLMVFTGLMVTYGIRQSIRLYRPVSDSNLARH
jgi:hypothetical protein